MSSYTECLESLVLNRVSKLTNESTELVPHDLKCRALRSFAFFKAGKLAEAGRVAEDLLVDSDEINKLPREFKIELHRVFGESLFSQDKFDLAKIQFEKAKDLIDSQKDPPETLQTISLAISRCPIRVQENSISQQKTPELDWQQEPGFVRLIIRGISSQNQVLATFLDPLRLSLSLKFPGGKNSTHLANVSFPSRVKTVSPIFEPHSDGISTKIEKEIAGNWLTLPCTEGQVKKPDEPHQYPSSRSTKVDWDKLDSACAKEADEEAKAAGGDGALQSLFREIYSKGDEATRRAMIKSFQTSCGTVLSTNWEEVKNKDFETEMEPPAGKDVKGWES